MTLQVEMSARLDASSVTANLSAELGGATGDLQGVTLAVSLDDVAGAGGAAASIDLSGLDGAVASLRGDLDGLIGDLPIGEDLIRPIRAAVDAVNLAVSGDFEADLVGALGRVEAEFQSLENAGALQALMQLAQSLRTAPELVAVREAVNGLLRVAGGQNLPEVSINDLVTSAVSAIDATGAMMTLETMLCEARRLGGLMEVQLPADRAPALSAALAAFIAEAEARLVGLDVADVGAVDQAIEALVAVRAGARALIEALQQSMAFGEATLVMVDPAALVARSEAALERLRGVPVGAIEAAMATLSAQLAPLLQLDLNTAPTFALDDLLNQVEARSQSLAGDLATLDLTPLTAPLATGLGSVTGVADSIAEAIERVVTTVQAELERVRDAVAALPLDQVANTLRDIVGVIAGVLAELGDLLGAAQAAIAGTATAAQAALARAEAAVDAFRDQIETMFRAAQEFVDGLGLDSVVGQAADAVQTVSDQIGQADMAPYFATAVGAIDTTAGVVEKVPFSLLPDSMEQDVVDLVRPIKAADLNAFRSDILDVLQIEADGTFALRPDLENAVGEIQSKLDELIAALAELHPERLAEEINGALDSVRSEVEAIAPQAELSPITEALDAAKDAVAALDVDAVLRPLTEGFDQVLAAIDDFQPSALVAPVEAEVAAARQKLLDLTRLETWRAALDDAVAQALEVAALIDPVQLEEPLRAAFADVQRRIAAGDLPDPLGPVGAIVSALLSGAGEAVAPEAIARVSTWMRATGGGTVLSEHSAGLRDAIGATRSVVEAVDPDALASGLTADLAPLGALVAALPAGPARDRLETAVGAVDLSADLRLLAPNHERYLAFLNASETMAGNLAAKGFGEVDTVSGVLRTGIAPLVQLIETPRQALENLGFTRIDGGLAGILGELFEVATPERLAGLLTPIYAALHGRFEALLEGFVQPLRDLIDSLIEIINLFDLGRLTETLDEIHAAVRAEIAAFHPNVLLGEAISAFADAQADVAAFDPLGPVIDTLEALQETVIRLLEKLDGDALLAIPIEIFETILAALQALDLNVLLNPLYDQLDAIAKQVADGLEGTVEAFGGLQDALPSQVGSTSISASVTVGG